MVFKLSFMEYIKGNGKNTKKHARSLSSSDMFSDEASTSKNTKLSDQTNDSTPIRRNISDEEESPYFPCSTQEVNEDVDVLWDWNSPQAKPKVPFKRKSKKRLDLQPPKAPLRRHLSASSEQIKHDFDKIREELRALKDEIAQPDHEESLMLSPREEAAFKSEDVHGFIDDVSVFVNMLEESPKRPSKYDSDDAIFNDGLEDQLILCSQRIESDLLQANPVKCDKENSVESSKSKPVCPNITDTLNNTLEDILCQAGSDFDELTQIVDIKNFEKKQITFPRSNSENTSSQTGKVEWHRTQSFETYNATISKETIKEIERKRLEAKAKLEAKRKHEPITEFTDSPIKCSPEEIEKKRLQALAKLEAKRQQDVIEKNKREALKRLELNRIKNATQAKSLLYKKL